MCVYSHVGGEISTEDRMRVFAALFSIALEHQFSILKLISMQSDTGVQTNTASAFALIRPLLDTVYRAFWGYFCASPAQFQKVLDDHKHAYPPFDEIGRQLKTTHAFGQFFLSHSHAWSPLSSYTHSGMQQIARRFDADGNLGGSNFTEEEIDDALNGLSSLVAAFAVEFFNQTNKKQAAYEVSTLYNKHFGKT